MILCFELEVTFDLLSNRRGILPQDQSYCLKRENDLREMIESSTCHHRLNVRS